MGSEEGSEIKRLQIEATAKGARLFRNSTGKAWQGTVVKYDRQAVVTVSPGDVVIRRARLVSFGLCVGSSDLIGWEPVEITQDMVGKKIARFVAIEVKTQGYKKTTDKQGNFLEQVRLAGGRGEKHEKEAKSTED